MAAGRVGSVVAREPRDECAAHDTDRRRSGLLPFAFSEHASFEDYAEYALNVPMYFIVRHGRWIDMTGIRFRQFLTEGHNGERATMEDWTQHLTTLFPEVRIKKYLEIRCIDQQPAELMLAVPPSEGDDMEVKGLPKAGLKIAPGAVMSFTGS